MTVKKFFPIAAIALSALTVSCTSDENNDRPSDPGREPITIAQPYINNSVRQRGALTQADVTEFRIWGFTGQPDSYIFRGNEVKNDGDSWTIDSPAKYWDKNRYYYFTAIAPASDHIDFKPVTRSSVSPFEGGGLIAFDCAAAQGSEDIIYAFTRISSGTRTAGTPVTMTFRHLLSRIVFRFVNNISTGSSIEIRDLSINNIPAYGTIDLTTGADAGWETTGSTTISDIAVTGQTTYGESRESAPIHIIPANGAYELIFTVCLHERSGNTESYRHNVTLNPVDYQAGNSYRFTATLTDSTIRSDRQSDIEFMAESVNEWNSAD